MYILPLSHLKGDSLPGLADGGPAPGRRPSARHDDRHLPEVHLAAQRRVQRPRGVRQRLLQGSREKNNERLMEFLRENELYRIGTHSRKVWAPSSLENINVVVSYTMATLMDFRSLYDP